LESLTQGERNVLYAARDYARFRKQFYFNLVSGDQGYLSLLLLLQNIRNLEANLESLDQNLRAHEALAQAGIVAPITVDQVFQSYQIGRLQLIRARNNLNNELDAYKVQLGLPPELEVVIDDSQLEPFELNSPSITQLQREIEELVVTFRELDEAPSAERLAEGFEELRELHRRATEQVGEVLGQWQSWDAREQVTPSESDESTTRVEDARATLKSRLDDLQTDLADASSQLNESSAKLSESVDAWQTLQRLARRESAHIGDLFVIQSQIRAYLIPIDPIDLETDDAVWYALNNRLDLMNTQAQVVDEWRRVHIAANALEADLDLVANAFVGTPLGGNNPARFSSGDSRFRVGFRFDSPLNRRVERNNYRSQVVDYERARRRYIARRDAIVQAVRRDLRELTADQLNFEIARQTLIAAARQVEQARIELLAPNQKADSSTTRDALEALTGLLNAKNALIAVWVSFETNRLQLLLDTEAMQLDERGFPQGGNLSESETDELDVILPEVMELLPEGEA
jgi:outer membrane protein TolC